MYIYILGPVIVDVYPETVISSILILQWSIEPTSLLASTIRVISEEEGSSIPGFPNFIAGDTRRHSFLNLVIGEVYRFEIVARAENGATSLPYVVRWEAGKSQRKLNILIILAGIINSITLEIQVYKSLSGIWTEH